MSELAQRSAEAFERIGRTSFPVVYAYEASRLSSVDFPKADEVTLREALVAALEERSFRDLERGHTSVGPHTDDLSLTMGGQDARAYASQGQARALVLSWKVAEIENLFEQGGVKPLLLLDDVSSELDPERNAFLMKYLHDSGAQTFLTTTDRQLVEAAAGSSTVWLKVLGGRVRGD